MILQGSGLLFHRAGKITPWVCMKMLNKIRFCCLVFMARRGCLLSWIYHEGKKKNNDLLVASFCDGEEMLWEYDLCSLSLCVPITVASMAKAQVCQICLSHFWYQLQTWVWSRSIMGLHFITFFFLILFQAIQERLQAWVN